MRCSRGELEEFFEKSKIWADICEELDHWIEDNHLLMEDVKGDMTLEEFKSHAALCNSIRRVKDIWAYMSQDFNLKEENENG